MILMHGGMIWEMVYKHEWAGNWTLYEIVWCSGMRLWQSSVSAFGCLPCDSNMERLMCLIFWYSSLSSFLLNPYWHRLQKCFSSLIGDRRTCPIPITFIERGPISLCKCRRGMNTHTRGLGSKVIHEWLWKKELIVSHLSINWHLRVHPCSSYVQNDKIYYEFSVFIGSDNF